MSTLACAVYVDIKRAEESGYFQMLPHEIFKKEKRDVDIENPIYQKDRVFVISGDYYTECCPELDLMEAEDNDWEYCPHCGESITNHVHEVYKDSSKAEKSKYFERFGMKEHLAVSARKQDYEMPKGLFND